ncbi:hypothetical protein ABVT39_017600 [Epinephelus coioides]
MAMELIIRASRWVVGGERTKSGLSLPPIRAYMDDMTIITTTKPCTRRLLQKLQENIQWARMEFKSSKSRSISIVKGQLTGVRFHISDEPIPTVLEKPIKSLGRCLVEEFKCAKVRLDMSLTDSWDPVVRGAAPTLATGKKWTPATAVQQAKSALLHCDIVGHVQQGRGGFGLGTVTPLWQKASATERRTMVVEEVCRQEEAARHSKAVAQATQGRWMKWEGTEKRKFTWSELWGMESNRLSFIVQATYDVLPSPISKDPSCPLCTTPATLKHILVGCRTSLTQGRYTWRHNQVLRCLADKLECKRVFINAQPFINQDAR